jgi:MtN3 and saliva related transmembrane protein
MLKPRSGIQHPWTSQYKADRTTFIGLRMPNAALRFRHDGFLRDFKQITGPFMIFDPIESLGLVAGLFGAIAPLLQVAKIVRSRRAADVSLAMFVVAFVGATLWLVYGLLKAAPSIVFWNAIALALFALIIGLKLRFKNSA